MRRASNALIVIFVITSSVSVFAQQAAEGPRSWIGDEVVIEHSMEGDLQILGGSLDVRQDVTGNIVAIGGDVSIAESASVTGDVLVLGGTLAAAGSVKGRIYAPRSIETALGDGMGPIISVTSDPWSMTTIALKLGLSVLWLIFALILALSVSPNIRASSVEIVASPFYSFIIGLLALSSFAVTALVASYLIGTGVGEFLLFALAIFAASTKIFGMVAVFHSIGWKLFGPRTHESARSGLLRGDLALVCVGLLVLALLRLIPVVGNVVWAAMSLIGTGAALSTFYGRRDPAFIGYQTLGRTS